MNDLNKSTVIVALAGKRKVGKDSICQSLLKILADHGVKASRGAFADSVKYEYILAQDQTLSLSDLTVSGPKKEQHRAGLIEFGETARAKDPLVWVRKLFENVRNDGILVVTDLRYPVELWALRKTCPRVLCYYVDASESARSLRGFVHTPGVDDNRSETSMEPWMCDGALQNDTEADLESNAEYLCRILLHRGN